MLGLFVQPLFVVLPTLDNGFSFYFKLTSDNTDTISTGQGVIANPSQVVGKKIITHSTRI